MYREFDPKDILRRLENMIGEEYEEPNGCLLFVKRALAEFGVQIEATPGSILRDGRLFIRVDKPVLGDIIIWRFADVPGFLERDFHVGVMVDSRRAIQSSKNTNGVGRIEITRWPWQAAFRGFYRAKQLCS